MVDFVIIPAVRVVPLETVSNGKNNSGASSVTSPVTPAVVVSAAPPTSINNSYDDIEVLGELPAQGSSSTPRSLREVRISLSANTTSTTSSTTNHTAFKVCVASSFMVVTYHLIYLYHF